jgi:hypothetical protein
MDPARNGLHVLFFDVIAFFMTGLGHDGFHLRPRGIVVQNREFVAAAQVGELG